ncbi:MAG TPA: hypothetical protein VGG42_17080 [Acidobacteriaceae bacterium]|jgi:hypothetical protein
MTRSQEPLADAVNGETARKQQHEDFLAEMSELGLGTAELSLSEIQIRIARVHQLFYGRVWHEFAHRAVDIRARALARLRESLETVQLKAMR